VERKEKINNIFLILSSLFVVMLGYGILLPTLPYYTERLALKDNLDADLINFHIGFLTSIYPLFQLLFVVIWGKLSDKYGRKPIIIVGLVGFVIMQLLTGLATSLTMLYVARIFGGVFTSSVIPVSNAYLSDITSEKRRTKIMAWSGVAISSGLIFGPVIGGFLSQTDFHLEYSLGQLHLDRFSVPFFFVGMLGLVVLFVLARQLNNTVRVNKISTDRGEVRLTFSKYFIGLLVLSFVMQFVVTLFETVFSIYGKNELAFNSNQVGIGFMLCGSVMAILQPFFASYGEKVLAAKKQIILGLLIAGTSLIIFPFFKNEFLVYGLIIVFAAGGAMVTPNLLSAVSLISKDNTGRNISIQSSVNSVGQILGPLFGTWLIIADFYLSFVVAGVIAVISAALFCIYSVSKRIMTS
jgi:DHA1 family multidrug resistance protein-like MFS transporter